jgi:sugar lactone lactonase YvrE
MTMRWTFEVVAGSPFGESLCGPAWDGERLLVCSPRANEILEHDPGIGQTRPFRSSTVRTRALALGPSGRLYGAQSRARRVVWYRGDGSTYYLEAMLEGQRHNDPQDLAVDAHERIWFADLWTDESIQTPVGFPPLDHCSVLRLDRTDAPDPETTGTWTVRRMTFDTIAPRAIALAPDERTLYVADGGRPSAAPVVLRAYPITDRGDLGQARVLHAFGTEVIVGGLVVDRQGDILVAVETTDDPRSSTLQVLDPAGHPVGAQAMPDHPPSGIAFGGAGLDRLYITTSDGYLLRVDDSGRRAADPDRVRSEPRTRP